MGRRLILGGALLVVCLASAPTAEAFVYWGDRNAGTLERANLGGTGVDPDFVSDIVQGPQAIAVDGAHLYWANRNESSIGRANLDGTGVDQKFITGAENPGGVAVDAARIYWANNPFDDEAAHTIGRANLNGTGADPDFITTTSNNLQGVAVDAAHVYWADINGGAIGRANLNGSNPDGAFLAADSPTGIAVNTAHIYWANFTTPGTSGTIGRADIDGSDPDEGFIPNANVANPNALAIDAGHIYWTNTGLPSTIGRASLDGTGANHDFITGLTNFSPAGLAVDPLSVPSCRATPALTRHAEPVGVTLPCTSGGGKRTFSIASQPGHGEISGLDASTGRLTYTPDTGFNGADSFRFRVRNPGAASNTATATVEVGKASNEFALAGIDRNKKKGTAELALEVPGAGELDLAGAKVKPAEASAGAAGEVDLLVKARGKARKKLKRKGKAKVAAEVTFSPIGGDPSTLSKTVKLVKK